MDFPKILKQTQMELHLTNDKFAKYLGKSRAWLQIIYSKSPNTQKFGLSDLTMQSLKERLDIPMNVMEEYNRSVYGDKK